LKWVAPAAGGGFTSLASGSLSGTETTVSITTTGYRQLVIYVKDVTANTDWFPALRLNSDTGANYTNVFTYMNTSTTLANDVAVAATGFYFEQLEATNGDNFQVYTIYDPANTTTHKLADYLVGGMDKGNTFRTVQDGRGQWRNNAAITGVTFFTYGSTYSAGTYEIYGVK